MNLYEKLFTVQQELKAPKSQFNKFGGYNYRNLEDIQEAAKPILKKIKAVTLLADEITEIEGRFYVTATARFVDTESGESITVTASAREEETKKGMDGSQITGASSSYARKYALNGLYAIDDTKDSDTTNTHGKDKKEDKPKDDDFKMPGTGLKPTDADFDKMVNNGMLSMAQINKIFEVAKGKTDLISEVLGAMGYENSRVTPASAYDEIVKEIKARL